MTDNTLCTVSNIPLAYMPLEAAKDLQSQLAAAQARIAELESPLAEGGHYWEREANKARAERDAAVKRIAELEREIVSLRDWLRSSQEHGHADLTVAKAERDAAVKRIAELERERDDARAHEVLAIENMHKSAKERDAARAEVAKLKALLAEAAKVIEANGYESGNQMFNVLIGGAPWSRDPIGVLKRIKAAIAAGNGRDAVKGDAQ